MNVFDRISEWRTEGGKCDLYDHGVVVRVRAKWDGLSILEKAALLGILHTTVCGVSKEWCEEEKNIQ